MKPTRQRSLINIHPALALALGAALAATGAHAQIISEVAGDGNIGVETLTTSGGIAQVPTVGSANWSTGGGDGIVYSGLTSPAVEVANTGTVTLTFSHRYNLEDGWDGGAVYVSVNDGTFAYVPGTAFTANGYDGDLSTNNSSVFNDEVPREEVFTGESAGYSTSVQIISVADLGTLNAGDTVAVRFRGGWDDFTANAAPNWEIGSVQIADPGAILVDVDFSNDGTSGFTVVNESDDEDVVAAPWTFTETPLVSRFEINADTLAADQYAPDIAGSEIQLNGADLEVEVLAGTLAAGQTFTIFDLSGGTTLTGDFGSFSVPGVWDLSQLKVDGSITCVAPPASVEEPFDYSGGNVSGKNGGIGFTGPWSSTRGNPSVAFPDRTWGSLNTSGGYARGSAWSGVIRPIGTTLLDKNLLDDGATLWFSVVFDLEGQNTANADINLALCNATKFESGAFGDRENLVPATAEGIGVTHSRADIEGVYWQDTDGTDGISERTEGGSSLNINANRRALIVGKIEWGATALDAETLTLYGPAQDLFNPGPGPELGTPILDAWATAPLDQATFNQIAIQFKDQSQVDEIRFGATVEEVLPPDIVPPSAIAYSPADEADGALGTDVLVLSDLTVTFDENVFPGTGNITIVETGAGTFETYDVETSTNLTFDGTTLTIDPTNPLNGGTAYHVEIDATAVTDLGGNAFLGTSGTTDPNWNFTTLLDNTGPVADTFSPMNGATDVSPFGNLVVTFADQQSIAIGTGNIEIKEVGTNTVLASIPVGDAAVTQTGPKELTIAYTIPGGTAAYVNIDAGAVVDASGNSSDALTGDTTWAFTTAAVGAAGPGSLSIFTAVNAGEAVGTSDLVHSFDGAPRLGGSQTPLVNGTDITMSAGHHLVIYNSRFDDPDDNGGARSEVQSLLRLNGLDLAGGWSQGYIRRDQSQYETITAGGAIIDVATEGDILQLVSFRTDSNSDGVIREPGNTGIQLLKLDDTWDYLRLAGHDGTGVDGMGADQDIPTSTSTWTDVLYTQELEEDTGSFDHIAGTGVTLKQAGHYLVLANTYGYGNNDREALLQRLALDGTPIDGSQTTVYYRNNESTNDGAASIGMIIETTAANQVLNVQIQLDRGLNVMSVDGTRTGLTIAKLPDSAEYIRLVDLSGDQNMNGGILAYDDDTPSSQLELDAAFTHSITTDPSRIGVISAGDFLFLASQYDDDDNVARMLYNQGWEVNGVTGFTPHGQTGRYTRDDGAVSKAGNWSGFMVGLETNDYVETVTQALGNPGTNTATVLALQGVNIASLFSATPSNGFGDWITGFGLDPADQDPTDDPDGDKLNNLLESLLGTDPSMANVAGFSAPAWDGSDFTFTHPVQDPALDDVSASYEWSLNGQVWNASGDTEGATTVTVGAVTDTGTATVTASVSGTVPGTLLVRLVATQS